MMSQQSTDQSRAPPRLYLVTPPVSDVAFAMSLADALDAGDVAAVLVRLPHADDHVLLDHVKALAARGGIYVAGGIVPKLGAVFAASSFRQRFEAKGRLRPYLAAIPTYVITHPFPAFLGLTALLADAVMASRTAN